MLHTQPKNWDSLGEYICHVLNVTCLLAHIRATAFPPK